MSHLLAGLPDDYLREIAAYFADQHVPYPAAVRPEVSTAILEAGRKLAQDGDAARGLPACAACHGAALGGLLPGVPGLLGLPRDYIGAQIGSWKNGLRRASPLHGGRGRQADAGGHQRAGGLAVVAAVPASYAAEPADSLKLPAECGSQARR